ncbi:MAG TPA: glycosyltransferase family 4 protein [Geobacteraceae bacterium]
MKVAIVHYWLVNMRGGEKVLEALCELFPQADVFTHVYNPSTISDTIKSHSIKTSFIQRLPLARKKYQSYLPLMPLALEQLDLRSYDLVISSESGPAKGVIVRPETPHICYCHTPMRYVWDMYHDYLQNAGLITRIMMPPLIHYLRLWDLASASRVDHFIANSGFVAKRIEKHYRRSAEIIHPPVSTADFSISERVDDFYLMVGQLVRYKRADLAVDAFNKSGRKLIVIGDGEQFAEIKRKAAANVTVMGRQPFSAIRDHYSRCKALIFPGVEDFGIVPVEAMASGRPVIAFRKGGALETVKENVSGLFFDEQTPEALNIAIDRFETLIESFLPEVIRKHATGFDKELFKQKFHAVVELTMRQRNNLF